MENQNKKLSTMWGNMKQRCYNPNSSGYKYYGGEGVTICEEWLTSCSAFKKWAINNGYEDGLSIDKDILCDKLSISPKIYSPETCLFITVIENNGYTRRRNSTHKVSYNDIAKYYSTTTQTLRNWRNGSDGTKRRYEAMYEYYLAKDTNEMV